MTSIWFPNNKYPPNTKNYLPCFVLGGFSIRRKGLPMDNDRHMQIYKYKLYMIIWYSIWMLPKGFKKWIWGKTASLRQWISVSLATGGFDLIVFAWLTSISCRVKTLPAESAMTWFGPYGKCTAGAAWCPPLIGSTRWESWKHVKELQ